MMLVWIDILLKILYRLRDIACHYLRKPFVAKLGKGSYLKQGVKLIGNPYRISIGTNFKIWQNCVLSVGKGQIIIGDDGLIGVGSILSAGDNTIRIGDGVAIAQQVRIIAYSHHYEKDKPVTECFRQGDIYIGNDVLIGAGVTILPGVTIGNGVVVAAGAVVTTNVMESTVVGGIPARIIKTRD